MPSFILPSTETILSEIDISGNNSNCYLSEQNKIPNNCIVEIDYKQVNGSKNYGICKTCASM